MPALLDRCWTEPSLAAKIVDIATIASRNRSGPTAVSANYPNQFSNHTHHWQWRCLSVGHDDQSADGMWEHSLLPGHMAKAEGTVCAAIGAHLTSTRRKERMIADWYVDPIERFDGRFFDGVAWTEQVSDGGVLRIDRLWPPQKAPDEIAQDDVVGPEQDKAPPQPEMRAEKRGSSDRRQIQTDRTDLPERRRGDRRMRSIVIPSADQH